MKKKWIYLLLAGWMTIIGSMFLGSLTGIVAEQHGLSENFQLMIQGIVMSGLSVPVILYLYQHVYRMTGVKPKKPVYSWKRSYHFITGVLMAITMASLGFIIASSQDWIVIEQWNTPDYWLVTLLTNIIIAFLYEALPEELGLRGMLYDVLRYRFSAWLALLLQTLLFLCVPLALIQLQLLFGLAPGNTINASYIILILCYGVSLQLLRLWIGSLWATIGFHLGYLEITRFAVIPDDYVATPIITYSESEVGIGVLFISFGMIIIGSTIVSFFAIIIGKVYTSSLVNRILKD